MLSCTRVQTKETPVLFCLFFLFGIMEIEGAIIVENVLVEEGVVTSEVRSFLVYTRLTWKG